MKVLSGHEIRQIREEKLRMTQLELSEEIDYSVRAIINIETGKTTPRKYFFEQLERLLAKPLLIQLRNLTTANSTAIPPDCMAGGCTITSATLN